MYRIFLIMWSVEADPYSVRGTLFARPDRLITPLKELNIYCDASTGCRGGDNNICLSINAFGAMS